MPRTRQKFIIRIVEIITSKVEFESWEGDKDSWRRYERENESFSKYS